VNPSNAGRTSRSWRRLRARILSESDICWLCGEAGADTLDHIVPLSIDATLAESADNVAPAHRSCNSRRGNRSATVARPLPTSRRW